MQINVSFPEQQTWLFIFLLLVPLFFSAKKSLSRWSLNPQLTNELKGLAILAVIFSHIGYFLSKDTQYLFPLSVLGGMAVNLFLFLSGYGLTKSALQNHLTIKQFYQKRLKKLYLPLWISLIFIFLLDLSIGKIYDWQVILSSFLGWYPRADLFLDLNSPLWYLTLMIIYYLSFPLLFNKKFPTISAIALFSVPYLLLKFNIPLNKDLANLYRLHFLAFPLGVFLASQQHYLFLVREKMKLILYFSPIIKKIFLIIIFLLLIIIFSFTAINSDVGKDMKGEQLISLITMFTLIMMFLIKNFQFRLLNWLGQYSYEIYLLHWPLIARHDLLFQYLPPFLATFIYIFYLLLGGYLLQKVGNILSNNLKKIW
jgi:peptidoglycan/LPS O-acetylase OafA/YrhL